MIDGNTGGVEAAEVNGIAGYDADGVEPHEATDAELEAYLANPDAEDFDEDQSFDEQPEANEDDDSDSSDKDREKADAESDEKKAKGDDRVATLQGEIAEMRQLMKTQESMIGKQASEIGGLRKAKEQLIAYRDQIKQGLADKDISDPGGAVEDRLTLRDIDQRVEDLDAQEGYEKHVNTTRAAFNAHFKQGDVTIEDMATALHRDGISQQEIRAFMQDPYGSFSGAALVQLGHRARAESMLMKLVEATKKLKGERDDLQGRLKKRRGSNDVIKSIESAARDTPSLTAASGGSNPKRSSIASVPHMMTDADLEEFLANNE